MECSSRMQVLLRRGNRTDGKRLAGHKVAILESLTIRLRSPYAAKNRIRLVTRRMLQPTYHHLFEKRWAKTSSRVATEAGMLRCVASMVWKSLSYKAHGLNQCTNRFHSVSARAITLAGWGAFFKRLLSLGCFPFMISSASWRIWIIASQNL